MAGSQSLFEVGARGTRVYIRYSKLHGGNRTFYGLRQADLRQLEGHASAICFLWEGQAEPLIVPFHEYEEVFRLVSPAADDQYKVQVYLEKEGIELYIAKAGRFFVEGLIGWTTLDTLIEKSETAGMPDLSHWQVQTLLGSIGAVKGFDIWIPSSDRWRLDWSLANRFDSRQAIPLGFDAIASVLQEVDVLWIDRGSSRISALFEVEHSTPIYSALLRFNDVHLVSPRLGARFTVVANEARHSAFVRQARRPTFQTSGLGEMCTFLDYTDVFAWHNRLSHQP
jgi:hypothetical protein